MAELYWIRTADMTNMFTEGYIGMSTKSARIRWNNHKASSKVPEKQHLPIYRAFAKYGADNLVLQVLVKGPEEYVSGLEIKLRPTVGIGWNCAAGGQATGRGRKASPETIAKRSAKLKGRKASPETRAKQSAASKGKPKSPEHRIKCGLANLGKKRSAELNKRQSELMMGRKKITEDGRRRLSESKKSLQIWEHSQVNKPLWSKAQEAFNYCTEIGAVTSRKLAKFFNLKDSSVAKLTEKLRTGWNPNTDEHYQTWLKEYTNSKENTSETSQFI